MTEVEVTQADRDAVKAFHAESFRLLLETKPDSNINAAHHALCEAFARHRHAAIIEGARLMQEKAESLAYAEAAEHNGPQAVDGTPAMLWDQAIRFASAIAALDPTEVVKGQP